MIELAKKHVETKLETIWLPHYFNSNLYKQKFDEKRTRMRDVVEDVLYLKNRVDSDDVSFKIISYTGTIIKLFLKTFFINKLEN